MLETLPSFGETPSSGLHADPHEAVRARAASTTHRILIVEDELWAALDIEWVVHKIGAEVVGIAATAENAIELAESAGPDLVLMDIRLAGERDGVDAAIEIRERFDIPSLFVSAHVDEQTRRRATPARALGFIDKPFTPDSLAHAIKGVLNPGGPQGSGHSSH